MEAGRDVRGRQEGNDGLCRHGEEEEEEEEEARRKRRRRRRRSRRRRIWRRRRRSGRTGGAKGGGDPGCASDGQHLQPEGLGASDLVEAGEVLEHGGGEAAGDVHEGPLLAERQPAAQREHQADHLGAESP